MSTETEVQELVINKLTKAQYEASSKSNTELYFVTDEDYYAKKTDLNTKQNNLISGTNIKTINNESILGSGNLDLDGLPSQTGQSGKYLTTNGTTASWAEVKSSGTTFRDWD